MKCMIMITPPNIKKIHYCSCFKMTMTVGEEIDPEEIIITYYSEQHAIDDGWKKTKDIDWCPPDQPYIWVCPECAKEVEWGENSDCR